MADFTRYPISEFFGPDGATYDKFSRENIPSKEIFRRLFNSTLFSAESKHSATTANAGHVLVASATDVKTRAYTSDFTKVADVTMLPGLMLGDATGYTIHGAEVLKDGISMHEYTNDTTGAKDFMIDFLANSSYFAFNASSELVPIGTVAEGVYWGTEEGDTTMGFFPLVDSKKVAVAGSATADYLNANQFQYVDNTVHIALKLSAGKIWVGSDYGAYESVLETATNTAFNKAFGPEIGSIAEIGVELEPDEVVITNASSKLVTNETNTGFNLALGIIAGTVSEGDHVHAVFTTTVNGFVTAPGTVAGKVLSDNGTWVAQSSASVPDFGYAPGEIVEIGTSLAVSSIVLTDASRKIYTVTKGDAFNKSFGSTAGTVAEGSHTHARFSTSGDGFVPAPEAQSGLFLRDDGTWATPAGGGSVDWKVKASVGDATPGFLDAKVDDDTMTVTNDLLEVKASGIGEVQLDSEIIRFMTKTYDHDDIISLGTPILFIECPVIASTSVTIEITDVTVWADMGTGDYSGSVEVGLITDTATLSQFTDSQALVSSVARTFFAEKQYPTAASETQLIKGKGVYIKAISGHPTTGGGVDAQYTVRAAYRLIKTPDSEPGPL